MQEFSSVTVSSYDADSLSTQLTGKSAEGWDVVSIVSAGSNIVAYLSRTADGVAMAAADIGGEMDETAADMSGADISGAGETGGAMADADADADADAAGDIGETAAEAVAEAAPYVPAAAAAPAVEEPAGWGAAPVEPEVPAVAETPAVAPVAEAAPVPASAEPTVVAQRPVETGAAVAPAAAAPQVESTVPAGWYADPSGRFELRYWDGSAWTEHVSRAGQQFTDPPVA